MELITPYGPLISEHPLDKPILERVLRMDGWYVSTFSMSCGLELCGIELTNWSDIRYTFRDLQEGFILSGLSVQTIRETLLPKEGD